MHMSRSPSKCTDGYAESFARARGKLESWMRGDTLDVDDLAQDLRTLPDCVCVTLMYGLPRQLSNEVLETVQALRH
jgi:hypothetical protein